MYFHRNIAYQGGASWNLTYRTGGLGVASSNLAAPTNEIAAQLELPSCGARLLSLASGLLRQAKVLALAALAAFSRVLRTERQAAGPCWHQAAERGGWCRLADRRHQLLARLDHDDAAEAVR